MAITGGVWVAKPGSGIIVGITDVGVAAWAVSIVVLIKVVECPSIIKRGARHVHPLHGGREGGGQNSAG